jgi:hypothetical protein
MLCALDIAMLLPGTPARREEIIERTYRSAAALVSRAALG